MNIKKSHSAVESFPAENRNEGILNGVQLNMQKGGNKEITQDEFVSTDWDLSDSKSFRKVPRTNSEIFNALNKNYREHGEPEFLKRLRGYSNGVSNVISCALQVLFANNPKLAELSYNDFLNRTGLKDDSFSDQTFLNNKNAFKIISKIKDHDTREKLRNCGVSVVVKFLRISERKDFEALIRKFLSGPAVSRSNAEKYLNSLFPTKKLSVRPEDAKSGSIASQAKVGYPNRFGCEDKPVDKDNSVDASVLAPEEARQEKDSEELLNNEGNPDIVLEEVNGYSRKSLGVRIDIVGHGQIDAEKIESSFESMREYLSLFVERYAEGEPEWNNIEKLMNYLKSHLDNKSQTSEKDGLEFAGADASDVPTENKNSPANGDFLAITESKLQGLPTDSPKQLSLGVSDGGSESSTEIHAASENADEKAEGDNTTTSQEVSGSPINESNTAEKDVLVLADTGSGKLSEKPEDLSKTEDTGTSANPGLTESPANASKDLLLEKVSVLMNGFTGNEVLALKQKLVNNITKVIRGSGIGYVPKDHPRAMQIAWEIVKNGLDAEKLRGVKSVAELYSKFFPNGNSKEGGL